MFITLKGSNGFFMNPLHPLYNDRQMIAKDFVFSVERLFSDLMKSGHPALDPLVITAEGLLSIKNEVLESPQQLCTILHGHR